MLGVYIHIPFCKNICNYCDFCKMNYNEKYTKNYLNNLKKEILSRYKRYAFLNAVYFRLVRYAV